MEKTRCVSGLWRHVLLGLFAVVLAAGLRPVNAEASGNEIDRYTVNVNGYLALRNAQAYDASNEIGKLYTGDTVIHIPTPSETNGYYFVYADSLQMAGYVNSDYLQYHGMVQDNFWTVKVDQGYLALRSEQAFDSSNELGELYTGDRVLLLHDSGPKYWLVYSPDLSCAGYVDCGYLESVGNDNSNSYYADNSVGGISTGLVCDMDKKIFSTVCLSFLIPDSWMSGITYNYYEDRIEFYCTAVKNAPGLEDGFLCEIYRTPGQETNYGDVTDLGYCDGYYYYLRRPTDFRANPNDAGNCALYQSMSADVDDVEYSLVIIGQ